MRVYLDENLKDFKEKVARPILLACSEFCLTLVCFPYYPIFMDDYHTIRFYCRLEKLFLMSRTKSF